MTRSELRTMQDTIETRAKEYIDATNVELTKEVSLATSAVVHLSERLDSTNARIDELAQGLGQLKITGSATGSARHRSSSERPRSSDPAYKQIAFKKIASHVPAEQRIADIEAFLGVHFPKLRIKDVFNVRTGPFPKDPAEERKLASVTLVEVSNSDVQREVLRKIKAGNWTCTVGGAVVEIKAGMTAVASARNSALRRAEKILKEDKAIDASTVKIEFTGSRGVTVAGVYAYTQGAGDSLGEFVKPYECFVLPP